MIRVMLADPEGRRVLAVGLSAARSEVFVVAGICYSRVRGEDIGLPWDLLMFNATDSEAVIELLTRGYSLDAAPLYAEANGV